ncbi:MAG: hypothetical protein ACYDAQ_05550 [Mycobacteriales bacterium]
MKVRRLAQGCAWSAALLLAVAAALLPTVSARAASTVPPPNAPVNFSGQAVAAGEHYIVDSEPPLTPVNELVSTYSPEGMSTLDSSGNANALASTLDARGAGNLPAFVCLAGAPCPPGFPPQNPLDAYAYYPQVPTASGYGAYVAQPLGIDGLVGFTPGAVTASASLGAVSSDASTTQADTATGIPGVIGSELPSQFPGLPRITAGSVRAVTNQYFNSAGELVVQAVSTVSNINIAGQVHITSLIGTATAVLDGVHPPVVTVHTTASGVTAGGQSASIGDGGVTAFGQGDNGAVSGAINGLGSAAAAGSSEATALAAAATSLAKVGIKGGLTGIHFAGDSVSRTPEGEVNAAAGGLVIDFSFSAAGAPVLSLPRPPSQLCAATDPIFSAAQLPVSLCALPGVDPNATYFGTVTFGAAGLDAFANNQSFNFGGGLAGGTVGATGGITASQPGTASSGTVTAPLTTSGVPAGPLPAAAPLPAVTASRAGPLPTATSVLGFSVANPAGRVKILALALLLAGAAIVAGRFGKAPPRLPHLR